MSARCVSLVDCIKSIDGGKRSKYKNRRTAGPAPDGSRRVYDSAKEAAYAGELVLRQRAGDITGWKPQVKIPLVVNGVKVCVYRADFEVFYPDGSELVEVKGYETREWKLKRKLLEAVCPDRRLTVMW